MKKKPSDHELMKPAVVLFCPGRKPDAAPCSDSRFGVFSRCCFLLWVCLFPLLLNGQTIRIKGEVKDPEGKSLPLANVFVLPDSIVIPSDTEGTFSTNLRSGPKEIRITYTGFEVFKKSMLLMKDTTVSFLLEPSISTLREVSVTTSRYSQEYLVQSARTGTTTLTKRDLSAIPVLGGEADIIKTLQLLPGTIRGVEGSSDLFVRGGAADQNLVLLDGAPVYNTSHLFGFLSVFNSDILEKAESVNGGFPAEFGGRLSSVLDITSNNRIAKKTTVSGDIGLISSGLYIEQPIIKDKLGVWVAGRRSYIDQVIKATGEELPYFFYDLNGKIIFEPTKRDQLSVSYYSGEDILNIVQEDTGDRYGFSSSYVSGNTSQTLQWCHQYPGRWNSHLALTRTAFSYELRNAFLGDELNAFSLIEDYGAKMSFEKDSLWGAGRIKAGLDWTKHSVSPNIVNSTGFFVRILESSETTGRMIHEAAPFVQYEIPAGEKLLVNAGFRVSFALLGHKEYFTPEPRLSMRYSLRENQSVKVSYSRMAQYMHRISNSAVSTPADLWYTVTDSIQPQRSHQLALAWQMFRPKPGIFLSAEAYFKDMDNLVGYEEGTNLFFNPDFESKLIQGRGLAYGVEFLMRKESGKFTGWLSYTLSWSRRQFNEINRGNWFPSRYDRRHNGSVVMQYRFHNRWAASMVGEFISGSRFTPIIGQYIISAPTLTGVDLIPLYSGINEVKLADTHRLDVGLKFMSRPERKFSWELFAGVNNVYNRASPVGIMIEKDEEGNLRYIQPGLFGLLPFIRFGFDF